MTEPGSYEARMRTKFYVLVVLSSLVVYWVLRKDPWYNHLGQPFLKDENTQVQRKKLAGTRSNTESLAQQCRSPNG